MNEITLDILDQILKLKVQVSISLQQNKYYIDLNTQMKSECILICDQNNITAHMRYNQIYEINSIDDVIDAVRTCLMGRTYANPQWLKIINI